MNDDKTIDLRDCIYAYSLDADGDTLAKLSSPIVLPSVISVGRMPGWLFSSDPRHSFFVWETVTVEYSDDPLDDLFSGQMGIPYFQCERAVLFDIPVTTLMLAGFPLLEALDRPYAEVFKYREGEHTVLRDVQLCAEMLRWDYRPKYLSRLIVGLALLLDRQIGQGKIKASHGGARYVKVADLPRSVREELGSRYVELKEALKRLKRDAKKIADGSSDWQSEIFHKYPILERYRGFIRDIDPHYIQQEISDSHRTLAQWEITIQIAACEVIPGYQNLPLKRRPTAETLKKVAIFPPKKK